jgi:hypothetical protein
MDGAILATMITTGILKSDDGTTFYLDLDNGVLKGNFSELSIAGSSGATQSYADGKASAAQSAAISAAASDATSKANAAQSNAISAAASNTSSAISAYDNQLGQNAVFNKLTNNGQTQGIFLQDGKIYINGDYIQVNDLFTRNITASNFNITGGSININTNNQTLDYIRLNHTKSSTYIASNMFAVENKATADNPYLKTTMQGGGLFLSNTNTNKTLASLVTTTGSGVLLLYDANEVLRMRLATNGAQVYDSNGNARVLLSDSALNLYSASNSAIPLMRLDDGGLRFNDSSSSSGTSLSSYNSTDAYIRNSSGKNIILLNSTGAGNGSITLRDGTNNRVILNDGGLYFYDSSGDATGYLGPYFKILSGVGNSGQVNANSYKDYSITFSSSFAKTPNVFPVLDTEWTNDLPAHMNIVAHNITKTGFTARVFNGNSSSQWVPFKWIAISF